MMQQQQQIYRKERILFIVESCPMCLNWKKFIERLNSQISIKKRIKVIDATMLQDHGIYDHPMLKIFDKHIMTYPVLFFEGMRIDGANTRAEAEAYVRSALRNDFIVPQTNSFIFDRECKYLKKRLFGKKVLVCSGKS